MDNFDLRKYIAEGRLLKEENKPEPKFKIGDKVKTTPQAGLGKGFEGSIWDVGGNKPENLIIKDGEYVYVVRHDNYRGKMVMSYRVKESDLINMMAVLKENDGSRLLKELKIPSGWTEEEVDNDEDFEDGKKLLKSWSAPMEGWDEEHRDEVKITIGEDGKHYQETYVSFGDYEEQGPFDSYTEALESAVEEMNALKENWDEIDINN